MQAGDRFRGYELERRLGRGGFGEVWLAVHRGNGHRYALKFLYPHLTEDATFRARLEREAKNAAALEHPRIVRTYRIDMEEDRVALVMEYVPSRNLLEVLRAETPPLSPARVAKLISAAAAPLDYLHSLSRPLVHRDLKPANLLLREGSDLDAPKIYLADFGISRHDDTSRHTVTGAVVGTLAYLPPEAFERSPRFTPAFDVWGLAVTAFECLTGSVPFPPKPGQGPLPSLTSPLPSVGDLVDVGDPRGLDLVFERALEHDPVRRFQVAGAFAAALERAVGTLDPATVALPPRAMPPPPVPVRERPPDAGTALHPRPAQPAAPVPEGGGFVHDLRVGAEEFRQSGRILGRVVGGYLLVAAALISAAILVSSAMNLGSTSLVTVLAALATLVLFVFVVRGAGRSRERRLGGGTGPPTSFERMYTGVHQLGAWAETPLPQPLPPAPVPAAPGAAAPPRRGFFRTLLRALFVWLPLLALAGYDSYLSVLALDTSDHMWFAATWGGCVVIWVLFLARSARPWEHHERPSWLRRTARAIRRFLVATGRALVLAVALVLAAYGSVELLPTA